MAPVKNTCPDIDSVIDAISRAMKVAGDARSIDELPGEADDAFSEIYQELRGLERTMEGLRSDNSRLRDWGHESEDKISELNQEIVELVGKIEDRDNEIAGLKKELQSVTENN